MGILEAKYDYIGTWLNVLIGWLSIVQS
jgi:hypothetical protein